MKKIKLNLQMFGGRGANSSNLKRDYIVVSQNNGKSRIVERNTERTVAENLSLAEATKNSQLLTSGKATLEDFGYNQKTTKISSNSALKNAEKLRKNKIDYAIQQGNYNLLPRDVTDKELEEIRKRMRARRN